MSAELNPIINTLRGKIAAKRAELVDLEAAEQALTKIQGGAGSATPKRRGRQKGNGVPAGYVSENSAEVKDAKMQSFMS